MQVIIIFIIGIIAYFKLKNTPVFHKIKDITIIFILCFLVISIVVYPKQSFDAAKMGVDTWLNIVFPALLPFFIGAELLINLGVVNFIGVLLEPIIRPIFNVPGEGSFVLAMSITSGYPIGIKLTTQLRNQGRLNKYEAQRLMSFCSTSGPLFMIGAVAIGMFNNLQLGSVLAFSHYLGAIATGTLFRFYKMDGPRTLHHGHHNGYITRAFREMFSALKNNQKTLGALMGGAVKSSIETLLIIGGFIVLFSVVIKLLTLLGIIQIISHILQSLTFFFPLHQDAYAAVASGIFEITIGCKLLSDIHSMSFLQQAVLSSIIISWSGFSIHAQAASLISKTDLSAKIYIFSKLIHAIFSGIFVILVLPLTHLIFHPMSTPVFKGFSRESFIPTWTHQIIFSSELFIGMVLFNILMAILLPSVFRIFSMIKKTNRK